jgi:hypothetical protein
MRSSDSMKLDVVIQAQGRVRFALDESFSLMTLGPLPLPANVTSPRRITRIASMLGEFSGSAWLPSRS